MDLGTLVTSLALFFALMIIIFEWIERRRDSAREGRVLEAIEREYQAYHRAGLL